MARTLMANNLPQVGRLVVWPIEDRLTVKNEDFTTKSVGKEYQDMRESITGCKKTIAPVIIIEETEDNVPLDKNLTYGTKRWDQISRHQTGLLEELFEIEENPHIDLKEKEDRKEVIILNPANHAATAWNRELQTDEPRAEQPHVAVQLHVEELRADESQDLQAINSVAMTPSSMLQTQDDEFKTIEEIKEEEERLMTEIERKGEQQKTINERLARIKKMREFLRKLNDIGEIEAKEENAQMENRLNEAIDDYLTASEQNTSFSDNFTIVDDNGKSTCEASMVVTLKDKRPKKNREKKTYRITYDITGSEINRSYYVFKGDDTISLQTNKAKKTTKANTSEITTRSMKRVRNNLSTKSDLNEAVQLRKRRKTRWSLRDRKPVAYESKKQKGRDPLTIKRNAKGRFVKKYKK